MQRSDIESLARLFDAVPVVMDEQGRRHLQPGPEWTAYETQLNRLIAEVKAQLVHAEEFQSFTMAQVHVCAATVVKNLLASMPDTPHAPPAIAEQAPNAERAAAVVEANEPLKVGDEVQLVAQADAQTPGYRYWHGAEYDARCAKRNKVFFEYQDGKEAFYAKYPGERVFDCTPEILHAHQRKIQTLLVEEKWDEAEKLDREFEALYPIGGRIVSQADAVERAEAALRENKSMHPEVLRALIEEVVIARMTRQANGVS